VAPLSYQLRGFKKPSVPKNLVGYAEEVFLALREQLASHSEKLKARSCHFLPMSALKGDNVVEPMNNMPWYNGPTLLRLLETLELADTTSNTAVRFPVQLCVHNASGALGYAGQLESGTLSVGDAVSVFPGGATARVERLERFEGLLATANSSTPCVVYLDEPLQLKRGQLLASGTELPTTATKHELMLCWMSSVPLQAGKSYLLRHTTHTTTCTVRSIDYRINPGTLSEEPSVQALAMNDIGRVRLETEAPLCTDPYRQNGLRAALCSLTRQATKLWPLAWCQQLRCWPTSNCESFVSGSRKPAMVECKCSSHCQLL